MPETRKLISLFEALAHQDWAASRTAALNIVEAEAEMGHQQAAQRLRGALNGFGSTGHVNGHTHELAHANGDFALSKALVRASAPMPLAEITLAADSRDILNEVMNEWRLAKVLQDAKVPRRNRLLFHGPPGCGKTVTALALAHELNLPAYVVRFDSLIGSYLGQTAARMREVFQFASQNKCVLLLDEIDVLGKRRGSQQDVGELDRIVVGLMQELDYSPARGFIIGASNLAKHLDEALWRRFDVRLEFKAPTKAQITSFVRRMAKAHQLKVTPQMTSLLAKTHDYAGAEKIVLDEARRKILRAHL